MSDWSETAPIWERHWARMADPARELIAERIGVGPGMRVLDMGCGTGEFCALAISRGASAAGLDAAEGMLEIARRKLPDADLRDGEIERLPWADDEFDVVTGFNSLQFAVEREAGFREAARVARPGGKVAVCVWGRRSDSDLPRLFDAIRSLAPADDGEETEDPGPRFGEPGVLEGLAVGAGLEVDEVGAVEVPYLKPDLEALIAALEFDVAMDGLLEHTDRETIRATVERASGPHRRDDGSYLFANRFVWVVASA